MKSNALARPKLGLRANLGQFVLYSVLTLWVGWFLGMERVVVPVLGRDVFQISSFVLLMSFIATFGFVKAIMNLFAGRWSDRIGRKSILILGWLIGLPVPFILLYAPSWSWVVFANVLMGFNQALTWTMTVNSTIDLVGSNNRGFALGVNEFSGYIGQASGGVITGFLAASYGLRPFPFYFGLASVILGLASSTLLAKETREHALIEAQISATNGDRKKNGFFEIFTSASWRNKKLFAYNQAGLAEKFTDTLIWGVYPLFLVSRHVDLVTIGLVVGLYQVIWGVSQLFTGALSDRAGRKRPIVAGMWIMGAGIAIAALSGSLSFLYISSVVTGFGMALVYPTLLAGVADEAHPSERGASLGVYRFWRDSGYGFGALFLGIVADLLGILASLYASILILFVSGLLVLVFTMR
jgi:MFS family permease